MKKGLVLEGGAMRGLFTAGIIDVFLENDISFDGVIGVSAGAAFGCNYKSKQAGRVIRYNTRYCRDKRYCSWRSLLKTGDLYNADFCYRELPQKLDPFDVTTFTETPVDFFIVCTDVTTGTPVYKKLETLDTEELEWLRASASMPLVSRIVSIGQYRLLDGGIADSIPVKYFETIGYTRNVVILTRPENYVKKQNALMPLLKVVFRRYPQFVAALQKRHTIYNETLDYLRQKERAGDVLIIRPQNPLPVGKIEHNSDAMRKAYDIGRDTGVSRLDDVRHFLRD